MVVRLAVHTDRPFIVSSWSASFRLSDRAGMIAMDDWADVMHPQIEKVLDRRSATTVVAVDGDTGVLQGFICADASTQMPCVFFVYVKEAYRRTGIARGLFGAVTINPLLPFTYACRTALVGRLRDKIPCAKHDHLRARFPEGAP